MRWNERFEVNYHGHVALAKSLLPHLIENAGYIVAIGSIAGTRQANGSLFRFQSRPYCVFRKLEGRTEEDRIKVQVISPGL